MVAGQLAVTVQVPVPVSIVTFAVVVPVVATLHTPAVPEIVGSAVELVVAVTPNGALYAALAGAPVSDTTGVASAAAVLWLAVAPA